MKRFRLFGIILISALAAVFAVGCAGSTAEYKNNVRVVYELEGGVYKNSTRAVELYYGFARGGEYAIKSVEDVTTVKIERSGYHIEGWYTSKTETDGAVSYDGKWDFATDKVKVDENGKVSYGGKTGEDNLVRLYARWSANVTYEYNVGYVDAENKFVKVGTVETECGRPFGRAKKYEIAKLENDREGYTSLGRYYKYDAEAANGKGEELTDDFAFEESKENVSLDIVVDYIEGNFRVVREAKDITSNASADKDKNKVLYLMNDIDFGKYDDEGNLKENGTIDLTAYNGVRGNGFKMSNFTVNFTMQPVSENAPDGSDVTYGEVSLFGDIDGGEVTGVTFDNVKFAVRASNSKIEKIFFAPLCIRANNVTFDNAVIKVTEFVLELYYVHDLAEEGFINDGKSVYYVAKDGVMVTNCTINVCDKTEGAVN